MADWTSEHDTRSTEQWEFDLGRDIKVTGIDEFKLKMHDLIPEVRKALELAITEDANRMRDLARQLASGSVINEITGKFVASIQSDVTSTATSVFGHVYSDDPRDPLFEYGGTQDPRDILPNAKQALRFLGGSVLLNVISLGSAGMVYAAIVHRPAVDYPKRPIIHEAYDEMSAAVEHDIESAASSAVINHGW